MLYLVVDLNPGGDGVGGGAGGAGDGGGVARADTRAARAE